MIETGGSQCGICTPGILMAGRAFLDAGADATETAVREAIAGNLCRCTGYTKIIEAIERAALAPDWEGGSRLLETWRPFASPGSQPGTPIEPLAAAGRPLEAVPSVSPRSLDEALRLLSEGAGRPVAGATDLMVLLAAGGAADGTPLLDLWGLDELRGIRLERGGGEGAGGVDALVIGALTTYAELRRSPAVAERLPVFAEASAVIGAAQIQNRGTIGGNIANASPAGDTLPILLATDAVIVLVSVRGERPVPAAEFFTGYRQTARAADELILRVEIPLPPGRQVRFHKVGTRRAQAISKVAVAVSWREAAPSDPGIAPVWRDVRVALGSVAPIPVRARATEAVLEGSSPTREIADRAAAAVAAEITPIDDVRSTADYRRAVTARVLRRIILDAAAAS
jgi:xanthine dehydrogenase iron-sulfur cluster and FAD-binding subunit A